VASVRKTKQIINKMKTLECNIFDKKENVRSRLVLGVEKDDSPEISVIMPVYNHPDFFEKSLLSVINQVGDVNYEVIIVDNGHPSFQKKNEAIVRNNFKENIRYYVNEENIGGVGSENRGILLSKGKYITYCHDDDLLCEDALQTLLDFNHRLQTEGTAIFGNFDIIDENDEIHSRENEFDSFLLKNKEYYTVTINDFLFKNYTNGCGALYLRDNLIAIGGYSENFIPCPDYAMNAYYTIKYGSYAIKAKTLKYRMSQQSDTSKAYKYLVDGNRKIINQLLELKGFWGCVYRPFVDVHLKVTNYHLYTKWSDKKMSQPLFFFYRAINRVRLFVSLLSKSLRSSK
jgi:glycosyltransferase involved in cell wall biosynthesis